MKLNKIPTQVQTPLNISLHWKAAGPYGIPNIWLKKLVVTYDYLKIVHNNLINKEKMYLSDYQKRTQIYCHHCCFVWPYFQ